MGKTRTFEEELKQLEAEVSLMEEGNLPLDPSGNGSGKKLLPSASESRK